MKKFVAFVIVFIMILSVTSYADDYDKLFFKSDSGTVVTNVTLGCDELSDLKSIVDDEFLGESVDINSLIDGLENTNISINTDYKFTDDYSSGKIAALMEMSAPVRVNSNMELSLKVKYGWWFLFDLTNEENPVVKIITSSPDNKKYTVIDIVEECLMYGMDKRTFCSEFKKYINEQNVNDLTDSVKEIYKANSQLSVNGNEYTLKISDAQIKKIIPEIIDLFLSSFYELSGDIAVEDIFGQIDAEDFWGNSSDDVHIDTVIKGKTDKNGILKTTDSVISLSFDVNDSEDVQKNVTLNVNEKSEYSKLTKKEITVPQLTEENSRMYYETEYMYDDCSYINFFVKNIPSAQETFYVPLGDMIRELRDYAHYCKVDNNGSVIVITCDEGESFKRVEVSVGSSDILIDAVPFTMANPVIYDEGKIYVDNTFAEKVFGYSMDSYRIDLINDTVFISFVRECPLYLSEYDEEYYEEDDYYPGYEFCWHIQSTYVPIDVESFNEGYFGLRKFVDSHCLDNGVSGQMEISYDNGDVVLKNFGVSEYFKEARITVGSNIITVDGKDFEVLLPAVNKNGTVYVDEETLKAIFKYELKSAYVSSEYEYNDEYEDFLKVYKEEAIFKRVSPLCSHYTSVDEHNRILGYYDY